MNVIRLSAFFLMLFSFSAVASETWHHIICDDFTVEKNKEIHSFRLPDIKSPPSLRDFSNPVIVRIRKLKLATDGFYTPMLPEKQDFLNVKISDLGITSSTDKIESFNDFGEIVESVNHERWIKFHISAVIETSSPVAELVNGKDGFTKYLFCTDHVNTTFKHVDTPLPFM